MPGNLSFLLAKVIFCLNTFVIIFMFSSDVLLPLFTVSDALFIIIYL